MQRRNLSRTELGWNRRWFLGLVALTLLVGATNRARADEPEQPKKEATKEVPAKDSQKYLAGFKEAVAKVSYSTVRVQSDGKDVALGAVVGASGLILTKASELKSSPTCVFRNGKTLEARVVGIHEGYDLALLKVEAIELPTVEWLDSKSVQPGNWLVTPGPREGPVAAGVVSVSTRTLLPRDAGLATPTKGGFLGISVDMELKQVKIKSLEPDGPAIRSGFKVNDVIVALNGHVTKDMDALIGLLQKLNPGDVVTVKLKRGDEELELKTTLAKRREQGIDQLGGVMSMRRGAFSVVLQHDTILNPKDCGGPVVNLDGKTVGINIARSGRVESLAIPAEAVLAVLSDLESGKLAPKELSAEEKTVEAAKIAVLKAEADLVVSEQKLAKARKELADAEAKAREAKKSGN
jgi:serine protease Do